MTGHTKHDHSDRGLEICKIHEASGRDVVATGFGIRDHSGTIMLSPGPSSVWPEFFSSTVRWQDYSLKSHRMTHEGNTGFQGRLMKQTNNYE